MCFSCSVKCCKEHKEQKCAPSEPIENASKEELQFLTEDTVPEDKLKLLESSKELKNLLSNRHLRDFLKQVDNANDPECSIRNAMLEPIFVEFADACLQIIQPAEKETNIYNKLETFSNII